MLGGKFAWRWIRLEVNLLRSKLAWRQICLEVNIFLRNLINGEGDSTKISNINEGGGRLFDTGEYRCISLPCLSRGNELSKQPKIGWISYVKKTREYYGEDYKLKQKFFEKRGRGIYEQENCYRYNPDLGYINFFLRDQNSIRKTRVFKI